MSREIIEQAIRITGDISGFQAEMKKAADVAQRSFKSIERSAQQVSQAIGILNGVTAAVGGGAALKMADEFLTLKNRVTAATKSTGDSIAVFKELQRITQATGASLKDTTDVFQRMALAGPALGASNKQLLELTKTVEQLGVLGGASTAALNAGLLQFGQMVSSSVAYAEEFNSIVENLPQVAAKIAEGMGKTTGELRNMVIAGKVTSKQVFDALKSQSASIQAEFAKMPKSLGQSINILKESFASAFGELADKSGLITGMTEALKMLSDNAQLVTNSVLGIAVGMAVFKTMSINIQTVIGALKAMAVAATTSWAAATLGASLVVGALIALKDQQFKIGQQQVTLSTLMQATWEKIGPTVIGIGKSIGDVFVWAFDVIGKVSTWAIENMTAGFKEMAAQVMPIAKGLAMAMGLGKEFDQAIGKWDEMGAAINNVVKEAAKVPKEIVDRAAILAKGDIGDVSNNPLGKGSTGPTQAQIDAAKKQAEHKEKFFRALENSNKSLSIELNLGKQAADIAEKEAQFREQIGREILPDELAKLKQIVSEKQKLEALQAVKSAKENLDFESKMIALEMQGMQELQAGEQILNGIKSQGLVLNAQQIAQIKEQSLELEKQKLALATKNRLDGLKESLQQRQEELALGEDEAKVLAAIREAKKENKNITAAELDLVRQRVIEELKLSKAKLTQKRIEGIDEEILQIRQRLTMTEQEAEIYKQIREAVRENTDITNGQLATLRQKLDVEQQWKKLESDNKAVKDFLKDQQKTIQQSSINLIQNKELRQLAQDRADLEESLKRSLTEQEESWVAIGAAHKSFLDDAKRAQEIIKENRTEQEKFQDDLTEINDLYAKGLLSLKDYNTAYKNMSPAFQSWKDSVKDISSTFTKGLQSWVDGSKKLSDVWKDIGKNILKIASDKLLFKPIEEGFTKLGESLFHIQSPGSATSSSTSASASKPKGIMGLLSNLGIPLPGPLASAASFIPGVGQFIKPMGGKVADPSAGKDMIINARDVFINSGGFTGGALNAPLSTTPPPYLSKTFNPLTGAMNKLASQMKPENLAGSISNALFNGSAKLEKMGALGGALGFPLKFLSGITGGFSMGATGKAPKVFYDIFGATDPMEVLNNPFGAMMNLLKGQKPFRTDPILSPALSTAPAPVASTQPLGQNLFGGDFLNSLIAPLKGVFQNGIFSSLSGFFKNLFAGDFLGGIVNTVKGFFSNGILSGFSNIFSGLGNLFTGGSGGGLSGMLGGLGGLFKMTGQGGLFSTMLAPLSGLGSAFGGLGGLTNIFGSNGLFDVMTRPIRGYASGGRVLGNEPIITSERGAELWWPDTAGTIINNQQLNEMLLRSSMTTASRGLNMDITTGNYQGTPFYKLNNGADVNIPADIQTELTKKRAWDEALRTNTVASYLAQYGSQPDITKLIAYVKRPPQDLAEVTRQAMLTALPLMANARLAVNPNDIVGNAILTNHHVTNMAYNQPGAQFLFPDGDQKGRLVRSIPGLNLDPRLTSWADNADVITNLLWPQGIKTGVVAPSYQSSGMTWGMGGQSVVQTGDGDYETRLAAGLAEGPHTPYTMNPRNNNDPRWFPQRGTGNQTSPNNAPPLNGLPGATPSRSGLPGDWSSVRTIFDRIVEGAKGLMPPNSPGINDYLKPFGMTNFADGSLAGQMMNMFNSAGMHGFKMQGFADGGRPPVGIPSWIGERGKELFVPDQKGTIVPHDKAMNLGGQVNVQVVNNSGTPMVPNVSRSPDGRDILVVFDELVASALQKGGRASQAMNRQTVMQRG